MKNSSPVCMSSGQISVIDNGSVIPINGALLVPPYRRAYLVKEIHFSCASPTSATLLTGANLQAAQHFVEVQLTLGGQKALTRDFVPIGMFAPTVHSEAEFYLGGQGQSANQYSMWSSFRWTFPRPMYVQAGDGIVPQVRSNRLGTNGTFLFYMSVVGEVLPPEAKVPDTSCVPYVQTYRNNKVVASISEARQLENPFNDRPLYCQRFIGRSYLDNGNGILTPESFPAAGPPIIVITDQDRFPITNPSGVPFATAFEQRSHSLEHRRALTPKQWVQVKFLSGGDSTRVYYVSMIGYREEALN